MNFEVLKWQKLECEQVFLPPENTVMVDCALGLFLGFKTSSVKLNTNLCDAIVGEGDLGVGVGLGLFGLLILLKVYFNFCKPEGLKESVSTPRLATECLGLGGK